MQLTLLETVQRMLAAIDAENVTSVGETEEADMCVNIANRVFEQIAVSKRWRHFKSYGNLGTTAQNNELSVPSGTYALDPQSVYYNDQRVKWIEPDDFLWMTIRRDTSESNIEKVNGIKVYNDRDPIWFTSDDDETLRFDAFDTTSITGSNSDCIVFKLPTSTVTSGSANFDLPSSIYPAHTEYCIGRAMLELQQNSEGRGLIAGAKGMLARLGRNARLVDTKNDLRKWIVPRRSSQNLNSTQISFVNA